MDKVWFLYVEDVPDGRWTLAHSDHTPHPVGEPVIGPFVDGEQTEVVEHDQTPLVLEAGGRRFLLLGGRVVLRRRGTMRTGRPCAATGFYSSECDHGVNLVLAEGEEMPPCHEGGGHDTVWVFVDALS